MILIQIRLFLKIVSRFNFRLAGVILMIVGLSIVIYAAFYTDSSTYTIQSWDSDQPITTRGETPFQQYLIGLFGVLSVILGIRSFRFIPYAERDTQNVTELDLDPEES